MVLAFASAPAPASARRRPGRRTSGGLDRAGGSISTRRRPPSPRANQTSRPGRSPSPRAPGHSGTVAARRHPHRGAGGPGVSFVAVPAGDDTRRPPSTAKEEAMGARSEALATKFEAKANELTRAIERMSDADWKKVTTAEKWPVGVTAHHVAGAHEPIAGIVKTVSSGQAMPNFTMAMLDEMNAKHAKDFANCTK